MTNTLSIALMSAQTLPEETSGAPDWIHLLPAAGSPISTRDGRGPYRVLDAQSVMSRSLEEQGRLYLDENHSTDTAAKLGGESPARGWIVALQARADGIWGQVEWTPAGRALIESRAYRYISPVIGHTGDGQIGRIIGASLVNKPNLRGLTALHQEGTMPLKERLAELVGLNAEASDDDIIRAVTSMGGEKKDGETVALQSQLAEIGTALGVKDGDHAAILSAAKQAATAGPPEITALQSELASATHKINSLVETRAREKATDFVDANIRRPGVKPLREHYISRHMTEAEAVEKEILAIPLAGGPATTSANPPEDVTAHAEDPSALAGRATAYQKELSESGQNITYASAVRAVQDGKDKA